LKIKKKGSISLIEVLHSKENKLSNFVVERLDHLGVIAGGLKDSGIVSSIDCRVGTKHRIL
jgi:hypothetical protein